jgi:hypothetical protein
VSVVRWGEVGSGVDGWIEPPLDGMLDIDERIAALELVAADERAVITCTRELTTFAAQHEREARQRLAEIEAELQRLDERLQDG